MEPEFSHTTRPRRRSALNLAALSLFVICNLLIGLIGGAASFVFLANSTSPLIISARHRLGIDDNTGIAIPVKQSIRIEESSAVIDGAKKVSPAVVSISASQKVVDFFGTVSDQEVTGGTGFIITSDGLIVTNKHVVSAVGSYKVVLNDGRIFDAKIQAVDPYNDLAVIKIDTKDLPTVEIGSSENLQIGQYVIAVGNALGEFKNSVTLGVVSAQQRSIEASGGDQNTEKLSGLIQTDAAINPGNSGGPLVNLAGQVVGINTAIASTTGGSIGVGFAIPIDSVKTAIDSVRRTGEIARPYLGVRYNIINKALQKINSLPVDYGALIARGSAGEIAIIPGSPADKAGLIENDIILEINKERVDENTTLSDRLRKYQIGDEISLKLYRKGNEIEVRVKLEKQP